jgi:hypothetical protein
MKQIFYFDKKISNNQIKKNVGLDYYSEIKLNNSNLGNIVKNQKGLSFVNIKKLSEIETERDVIVITSNLFYSHKKTYDLFLNRLHSIVIDSFWGDKKSFIFKGNITTLINLINDYDSNLNLLKQTYPNCFYNLESIVQFKRLLSQNHDTRYFNDIKKTGEIITKTSKDKIKLKSEYDFLNNIPNVLKDYYAEVFSFKESNTSSEYKMRAYDMLDLSYQSINNNLNKEDFLNFFNIIESFIRDSIVTNKYSKDSQFDAIILKNSDRMNLLKKLSFYNELNNFIINHKGISINEHYSNITKYLNKFKSKILKPNFIFSHGDLCFSNILFDKKTCNIKLIDPRGYTDYGLRTPYYDVAKLSHSFLGFYDLIINDISAIHFDENMNARLKFDDNLVLINLPNMIFDMCNKLNLDYKIVRLIESSLFLSMLPLHSENKKKVFNLALRSVEIFQQIDNFDL